MAGTLLDLLGLTDPAAAIIAAATGGSVTPVGASGSTVQQESEADPAADPNATVPPATGSSTTTLPAAGAAGGAADPWAALIRLVSKNRRGPALQALTKAGQGGEANAAASNAKRFGGDVLGFGHREGKGDYAVVRKGGNLFHIYAQHGNKNNVKLDSGSSGVADALGLGQGSVVAVGAGRHRRGGQGSGANALSPNAANGPAHTPPLSEDHRVPVDPLTGGTLAPQADGETQAASATAGDVPMTAAEAYRRRLIAAHQRLGL